MLDASDKESNDGDRDMEEWDSEWKENEGPREIKMVSCLFCNGITLEALDTCPDGTIRRFVN